MSRHVLTARSEHGWEVVVGWDGALATFYALVLSPDDTVVVERGDPHDRIFQPRLVLDAVAAYTPIPAGLEHTLLDDALADTAHRTPTHHTADPWQSLVDTTTRGQEGHTR